MTVDDILCDYAGQDVDFALLKISCRLMELDMKDKKDELDMEEMKALTEASNKLEIQKASGQHKVSV